MPASDDLKFNVVDSTLTPPLERWVRGTDIEFPTATTAEGLAKVGDIDIDASSNGIPTTVTVRNSGAGIASLDVEGNVDAGGSVRGNAIISENSVKIAGGTAFAIDITATPTADRVVTMPDAPGTIVLQDASGDITAARWVICNTPFMRGATGTDNMRFNTSGVSGSRAVVIPSKSGTMAVGTTAPAIPDLNVGVTTVSDCATAINAILAVLRGFEQVTP